MFQHANEVLSRHEGRMADQVTAKATVVGIVAVIDREQELVCLDWSDIVPMSMVLQSIQDMERFYEVAFDLDDPDLLVRVDGGTRLYGMLKESLGSISPKESITE